MTKRAVISKDVRRTIHLRFLTDTGKIHTISLNYVLAELTGAEGTALVKDVMEKILGYDVFTVKLVKPVSAELVERRVLFAADDFQINEEPVAPEPLPEASQEGRPGGTGDLRVMAPPRRTQGANGSERTKWAVQHAPHNDEPMSRGACVRCPLPVGRLSHIVVKNQPAAVNSIAVPRPPPFCRLCGFAADAGSGAGSNIDKRPRLSGRPLTQQ